MATETRDHRQSSLALHGTDSAGRKHPAFVAGPNRDTSVFLAAHSTPYDSVRDRYDVRAFARDIIVDKAVEPAAIYGMHGYWSKKHWAAIREYIKHYLPKPFYQAHEGLVFDPFSGSGMTGVATLMEGKSAILIDASPAAAFISHHYVNPADPALLQADYEQLLTKEYSGSVQDRIKRTTGAKLSNLQEELDWLYQTRCDRCSGDATTEHVVYSQTFQCPHCGEIVALFDCPTVAVRYGAGASSTKNKTVCPLCLKKSHEVPRPDFVISTRSRRFGEVPVKVVYRCNGGCKPKRDFRLAHDEDKKKQQYFRDYDVAKIERLKHLEIPHPYVQNTLHNSLEMFTFDQTLVVLERESVTLLLV